jgi:tripartite-type tricarboxylate transporter receptor subunit TctC
VNVENKPGGSGTIGFGIIARAKPDGYTIGLGTNSILAYQPLVNQSLTFKTPDAYQPIAKLGEMPVILVVRADAPWKTFEEFIAYMIPPNRRIKNAPVIMWSIGLSGATIGGLLTQTPFSSTS